MSVLFKYCHCPKKNHVSKDFCIFQLNWKPIFDENVKKHVFSQAPWRNHILSFFFSNTVTTNYKSYFLPLQSIKQVSPAVKGMIFFLVHVSLKSFAFLYANSCMQNPQSAIQMWKLILWLESQPSIQAVSSKSRRWGNAGGLNCHGYSRPLWTVIFRISVGSGKKAPPCWVTSDYREDSLKLRPPLCWLLIRPGACSASLLCCGF